MSGRDVVLGRVRRALGGTAGTDPDEVYAREVRRAYRRAHVTGPRAEVVDLLAERLADYRAFVHRTGPVGLPALLAGLLAGTTGIVVPDGLPDEWLADTTAERVADSPGLTPAELDAVSAVVTGCAVAIAETGTLVLDAGPGQGRRRITLVPDHHVCVVRTAEQVVASVPQALARLDPHRPQTWVSGPSATSDIELDRVEGVHGPRRLDVVLLDDA
ncbi:LutC/YkgG family protein [Streptomyces sp. P6-2-1]|uniref:LutC/YkgG family protein n=1 Tax=unclassified Streptomyces TaxID=2593676 RepID=UPI003D35C801